MAYPVEMLSKKKKTKKPQNKQTKQIQKKLPAIKARAWSTFI
jgi:hypothetical protein